MKTCADKLSPVTQAGKICAGELPPIAQAGGNVCVAHLAPIIAHSGPDELLYVVAHVLPLIELTRWANTVAAR